MTKNRVLKTFLALSLALFLVSADSRKIPEDDHQTLLTVNGEPVSCIEFKRMFDLNRPATYRYFKQTVGIKQPPDFWLSSFGGERPLDWNKQKTLNDIKRIKVWQRLFKEQSIQSDITYEHFLDNFRRENASRREKLQDKKIFYGPQQFSLNAYFDHLFHKNKIKLIRQTEKRLSVQEGKLEKYYHVIKQDHYRRRPEVQLIKISNSYYDSDRKQMGQRRLRLLDQFRHAKPLLTQADDFEVVALQSNFQYETITLNETNINRYRRRPLLVEAAHMLPERSVSDVLEENGTYFIVMVLQRVSNGFLDFSEVKDSVRKKYAEHRTTLLFRERLDNVVMSVNKALFDNDAFFSGILLN